MNEGQRNILMGGVAIILIGGAVAVFALRGGGNTKLPTDSTIYGVCLACEEDVTTTQPLGAIAPYPCPHCDKQAVYPWMYCFDCNRRFVPDLVRPDINGPLRMPGYPKCPCRGCRSDYVGQYDPEMPNQNPVADVPLPKWSE